jgi:hypothetical protein
LSWYHEAAVFTGSVKVTVRLPATGKSVAPSMGNVSRTAGAASPPAHGLGGEAVLRGAGSPAVKSAALLSESVQPFSSRRPAVVFDSLGADDPSKKFAVP